MSKCRYRDSVSLRQAAVALINDAAGVFFSPAERREMVILQTEIRTAFAGEAEGIPDGDAAELLANWNPPAVSEPVESWREWLDQPGDVSNPVYLFPEKKVRSF